MKLAHATRLLITLVVLVGMSQANAIYNVSINTAPLIGHPAGPFTLDLQFIDGSGTADANNTVMLSGFAFGAGNPGGSVSLIGGVTGDLSSSVQMTDSSFFNEFDQGFIPGNALTFQIQLSTNSDTGSPDEFSLAILDSSGFEIPTFGPGNALVVIDIFSGTTVVSAFATDPSQPPPGGGPPINIAAPQVSAVSSVPEPGTLALLSSALVAVVRRKRPTLTRSLA